MYDKYFGFDDLPFRVVPEPRYFYSTLSYQNAYTKLRLAIRARTGFIVLTGEAGIGKTTLLKVFMSRAESDVHAAFIFNPNLTVTELLRFALQDFGIALSTDDKFLLMEKLHDYLVQQFENNHFVILLIDEAQIASDRLLEELRLLSNFETDTAKLIQIVLIGQPALVRTLDRPELRQLKQRITVRLSLDPLKCDEIPRYIDFRLKRAGYDGKGMFDGKAVRRIFRYSRGVPRLINNICTGALLSASTASESAVSVQMIDRVARDLQLTGPSRILGAAPFLAYRSWSRVANIKQKSPV
jgi:general secretion pathway protein A